MKTTGKTRVGIMLSMGVLVGLGLVILPGLFASSTPLTNTNSTSTSSNIRTPTPTYAGSTSSSASPSNRPALAPTTGPLETLAFAIALVLLPAISLSIFVRYLTLKGTRKRLESATQ